MLVKLFSKFITRFSLLMLISFILTGCGGGDGKTLTGSTPAGSTPTGTTPDGSASASSVPATTITSTSIALTLTPGIITSFAPGLVTATVKDAHGVASSGAIVTFSTSDPRGNFSGGVNTAISDSNGVAKVTLQTTNNTGGAYTVTANSSAATKSLNYSVGASTITLSPLTLPTVISAYGTAGVSVQVLSNNSLYTTPITVSFTSVCAASGKATLTSSVTSVNGIATATYRDNGCNNANPGDVITATLMNGVTASGNLAVNSPGVGSIQFVSAITSPLTTPVMITLKGTGGINRSETARVTFRVVDGAGNPLNAPVTFSLNTSLGGLTLFPPPVAPATSVTIPSDPITGYVSTYVQSGTMSTTVRVTASTCSNNSSPCTGSTISTQSDLLVISTGIPAQDAFSLSATSHNIEGWNWDGVTTTLTARLADHFHNPVPDGTAVYFTTEGGAITPSCTTVGGACSAVLTSQNLRPTNGRVTVLARAIGEETFTDLNSNGVADPGEMIDANGHSSNIGYAYMDYNENGVRDADEPYFDFNGSGSYLGTSFSSTDACTAPLNCVGAPAKGDSLYHGILCNAVATPGFCSVQKSIDVRGSQVIVFSSSNAKVTINGGQDIILPSCSTDVTSKPVKFIVTIVDENGNSMPAGTAVAFSTTTGTITDTSKFVTPDTTDCLSGSPGCPASSASTILGNILVTMQSDATLDFGVCTYPTGLQMGTLTVKVTSPKGIITQATANVSD